MSRINQRTVRLSQTIVPFGVGAVYDVFGESFVACDIRRWGASGKTVHSPTLAKVLGVSELKSAPPVTGDDHGIPYLRFPRWLFCQKCRTLRRARQSWERENEPVVCFTCSGFQKLVPMRFVVACKNGHLGDVPWHIWAHSQSKRSENGVPCTNEVLEFRSRKSSNATGLASLEVACAEPQCRAHRSLSGITAPDSLEKLGLHCLGAHPWQPREQREQCDAQPRVVQRGASNLYFANVASALDIPVHSEMQRFGEKRSKIEAHNIFRTLKDLGETSGPFVDKLVGKLAEALDYPAADIFAVLNEDLAGSQTMEEHIDVAAREWAALINPQIEDPDVASTFITRHTSLISDAHPTTLESILGEAIPSVVLVTRLKEVRALRSFSRIEPEARLLRPDLSVDAPFESRRVSWLPAIEVFGEGVFLRFNEELLAEWERAPQVRDRVGVLHERLAKSQLGASILRQRLGTDAVEPRFVLLHTFAHLLIRELCFECGYSSAALRERIYSRTRDEGVPQAGILVYTAAGDSEGTLGGLVRQGEAPRLIGSIVRSLESGVWCSADPICRESDGQGYDKTNLAACHACCLLPETSCVCGNLLLDRSLVVEAGRQHSAFFIDPAALVQ